MGGHAPEKPKTGAKDLVIAAAARQGKLGVMQIRDPYGLDSRWGLVSDGVVIESFMSLAEAQRRVTRALDHPLLTPSKDKRRGGHDSH
ncbi:MAG: hypothetical protein K2Q06_01175 [Parvularculaceae bacterium]|nr:hypothetical protein [Parvularculaceae bacterium]